MSNGLKTLTNGLLKENPTFVLVLGMCPTLATTTSAINGMSMGLATMFVLVCSNIVISLLKNLIPDKVRIPAFIVVIATFVTIVQLAMQAYLPSIYEVLGLFIPLIVVNCIVLGRAEAFAAKNSVGLSALDGIGMGLGFTLALTLLGADLRPGAGCIHRPRLPHGYHEQAAKKVTKYQISNIKFQILTYVTLYFDIRLCDIRQ